MDASNLAAEIADCMAKLPPAETIPQKYRCGLAAMALLERAVPRLYSPTLQRDLRRMEVELDSLLPPNRVNVINCAGTILASYDLAPSEPQ